MAAVFWTTCTVTSVAQAPVAGEYRVKAAFLYNFAKFVEWPAAREGDSATSIGLCVLGEDPFGADLDQTVRGNTINGRPIAIRRDIRIENLAGCQVLFISASERDRLRVIFAALRGRQVLTVGDVEPFARIGGIISFTLADGRVRFEINVDAAERAGLRISSQLLNLARVIRDSDQGPPN